jgi:uncharacterized protein YehS (DUF1456 family)
MIEEYIAKAQRKVMRPALVGILFMPADENQIRTVLERVNYTESVWRDNQGHLLKIQDKELQAFLNGLEKREKRAKVKKKPITEQEMEYNWFEFYADNFGRQAAIKRFGKDLRDAA